MKHEKRYVGNPSGGGQIVCSCGYKTPIVDDANAFTLGRKLKSVEQYFQEHLAEVETEMLAPGKEQAIAPVQKALNKLARRK